MHQEANGPDLPCFFFWFQFIVQGHVLPILHIASCEFGDVGGGVRQVVKSLSWSTNPICLHLHNLVHPLLLLPWGWGINGEGGRSASGVGVKVLLVVGLQPMCWSPFKEALIAAGMSSLAGPRVT